MKSFIIQSLSLTALLTLVGCSKPAPGAQDSVELTNDGAADSVELISDGGRDSVELEPALATVNGTPITEADFRRHWEKKSPVTDDAPTRSALLSDVVDRQVLVERARSLGLTDDPVVRETLESALIARLKEIELQPKIADVAVYEAEVRAAYDATAESFTVGAQIQVAVLWFNTRGQTALANRYRPRLEVLRTKAERIPATDGFSKLATTNTEHRASRYRGGIIPALQLDAKYNDPWRQQILEIATPLKTPGELSPIIANEQGIFLVRLIERREVARRPYEHVRAGIEERLLRERRDAAHAAFKRTNHQTIPVKQFSERLAEIEDLPVRPIDRPSPPAIFALEVNK